MSVNPHGYQRWRDVCFLHWAVDAVELKKLLPDALGVDTFQGQAYLGLVPFRMEGVRLRGLPRIPTAHAFPELNVRTYVEYQGRTGVWFFSLDASSALAVAGGRALFGLPYYYARMSCAPEGEWIRYRSDRRPKGANFEGRYRGTGPAERTELELWLTERYRLFAQKRGRWFEAEVEHEPWPLQNGEAEFEHSGLSPITLPATEPLIHYATGVDVVIGSPRVVG